MDNIQNSDAELQAALVAIKMDKTADGMRVGFKNVVAFLLPVDPVSKRGKQTPKPLQPYMLLIVMV